MNGREDKTSPLSIKEPLISKNLGEEITNKVQEKEKDDAKIAEETQNFTQQFSQQKRTSSHQNNLVESMRLPKTVLTRQQTEVGDEVDYRDQTHIQAMEDEKYIPRQRMLSSDEEDNDN